MTIKKLVALIAVSSTAAACFVIWDFHQYLERMKELGLHESACPPSVVKIQSPPLPTPLSFEACKSACGGRDPASFFDGKWCTCEGAER